MDGVAGSNPVIPTTKAAETFGCPRLFRFRDQFAQPGHNFASWCKGVWMPVHTPVFQLGQRGASLGHAFL